MRFLIVCLLCLAACGRPLTLSETSYLRAVQGDQIDPARIRLFNGHVAGAVTYEIPVRPRTTCQERIWPPMTGSRTVTVSPAATVLFNRILLRKDVYRTDFMPGWPEEIDLLDAMLFAHEMTHVWQWQNRAETGYHPLKALSEHSSSDDPYLFDPESSHDFLSYGYEQQGSIVEEYVCCRLLAPNAHRTARLRKMIDAYMPVSRMDRILDKPKVRIPWAGAELDGICGPAN